MNVVQYLFENSASLEKDFVLGHRETLSFSSLYDQSSRLANHLSTSYGSGKNILLASKNNNYFLVCYFGILLSGNVCVPIDPAIEKENFEFIVNEIEGTAYFIESRLLQKLNVELANVTTENELQELIRQEANFPMVEAFDENSPALIIYTSGSTGRPKGVVLSHRNIMANTSSIIEYLKLDENDIIEVVLPFFYCYGLSLLHTHLRVGGSLVLNNNFILLGTVLDNIKSYNCTGFAGVPSHFQILLRKSESFKNTTFPSLRYVTQAGGKLHNNFIEEFNTCFPDIDFYVMYGQTEATARLSYLDPKELTNKIGSIGKGIPGVELKVVNKLGGTVEAGETGELVAKGDNIMLAYYKDPDTTKKTIKNGWLHTGDLGKIDNEGFIYLTGRKKEIIKVSGKRVSPKEIEAVILSLPEVVDCTIEPIEDEITGEAIKATVVLNSKNHESITEESLKIFCRSKLALHKVPKVIEFSDTLKINSVGKKVKKENEISEIS